MAQQYNGNTTRARAAAARSRAENVASYYYGNVCPAHNPDDSSLVLGLQDTGPQKEVLRHFLKATDKHLGTFGTVKQGRIAPDKHSFWPAAKAYYESGCVVGPNCAAQQAKPSCANIVDPKRGFLCRWNQTSQACENRPADKVNYDGF